MAAPLAPGTPLPRIGGIYQVRRDTCPQPPHIRVVGQPIPLKLLRGMTGIVKNVGSDVEVELTIPAFPAVHRGSLLYPRRDRKATLLVSLHHFWDLFGTPTLNGSQALLNRFS